MSYRESLSRLDKYGLMPAEYMILTAALHSNGPPDELVRYTSWMWRHAEVELSLGPDDLIKALESVLNKSLLALVDETLNSQIDSILRQSNVILPKFFSRPFVGATTLTPEGGATVESARKSGSYKGEFTWRIGRPRQQPLEWQEVYCTDNCVDVVYKEYLAEDSPWKGFSQITSPTHVGLLRDYWWRPARQGYVFKVAYDTGTAGKEKRTRVDL
jgi:hypothetical protein